MLSINALDAIFYVVLIQFKALPFKQMHTPTKFLMELMSVDLGSVTARDTLHMVEC